MLQQPTLSQRRVDHTCKMHGLVYISKNIVDSFFYHSSPSTEESTADRGINTRSWYPQRSKMTWLNVSNTHMHKTYPFVFQLSFLWYSLINTKNLLRRGQRFKTKRTLKYPINWRRPTPQNLRNVEQDIEYSEYM